MGIVLGAGGTGGYLSISPTKDIVRVETRIDEHLRFSETKVVEYERRLTLLEARCFPNGPPPRR